MVNVAIDTKNGLNNLSNPINHSLAFYESAESWKQLKLENEMESGYLGNNYFCYAKIW